MSNLKGFLKANSEQVKNEKFVASKRFKDDKGNPIPWEIRCLTKDEIDTIRSNSQIQVTVHQDHKKKGIPMKQLDVYTYLTKLAVAATVYPELDDTTLQDSYGVKTAYDLYCAMLTPGEAQNYEDEVQAVNGFDIDFDEKVDEAKN
jgi:hypothetical protein